MADIKVTMKDGTVRQFRHQGRAGGSYTKEAQYKGAFFVIKDEWGVETAIPAADIAEAVVSPNHGY